MTDSIESSNRAFIIAAYGVTWAVLLGYLWYLSHRGARARAESMRVTRSDTTTQ